MNPSQAPWTCCYSPNSLASFRIYYTVIKCSWTKVVGVVSFCDLPSDPYFVVHGIKKQIANIGDELRGKRTTEQRDRLQ